MKEIDMDTEKLFTKASSIEDRQKCYENELARKYKPLAIILPIAICNTYNEAVSIKDQYLKNFDFDCINITQVKEAIIVQKIPDSFTNSIISEDNSIVKIEERIRQNSRSQEEFNTKIRNEVKEDIVNESDETNIEYFKQIIYKMSLFMNNIKLHEENRDKMITEAKKFVSSFGDNAFDVLKEVIEDKFSRRHEFNTYDLINRYFSDCKRLVIG